MSDDGNGFDWEPVAPEVESWDELLDLEPDIEHVATEFDAETGGGFIHIETEGDWYDFGVSDLDEWDALIDALEDYGIDIDEIDDWYH